MLTIAIQAGGRSERMGGDKALLPLAGVPLIEHVLSRISGLGDELFITTNTSYKTDMCDQVVVFDSETMMPQIYRLLNSYFLIFIFNSSEDGIFKIMGAILASI